MAIARTLRQVSISASYLGLARTVYIFAVYDRKSIARWRLLAQQHKCLTLKCNVERQHKCLILECNVSASYNILTCNVLECNVERQHKCLILGCNVSASYNILV